MLSEILLATTNESKVRELKQLFADLVFNLKIYSLKDYQITSAIDESGKTFVENSIQKAQFYSKIITDKLVIAEDSGLEVMALGGEPGIFSARYAGLQANDQANINKLLTRLKPHSDRRARFVSAITISLNGEVIHSFIGTVTGRISRRPEGKNGFGYDPVFYYPPLKKTFAQLNPSIKNQYSHRSLAFRQLKNFIQNRLRIDKQ